MEPTSFTILYVTDTAASTAFWGEALGKAPLESAPTFAMFALAPGAMLGLWRRDGVSPKPTGGAGAMEVALTVADDDAVRAAHAGWRARGLPDLEAPTSLDFGFAATTQDPDGHRLRVFAPRG